MEDGVIEIKECPICGSTKRYVEELTKQAKEDGVVPIGASYCTHIFRDTIPGKNMLNSLPMGTKIFVYEVWTDVCLGFPDKPCGNIYTVKVVTNTAVKTPQLVKPDGMQGLPFSPS